MAEIRLYQFSSESFDNVLPDYYGTLVGAIEYAEKYCKEYQVEICVICDGDDIGWVTY